MRNKIKFYFILVFLFYKSLFSQENFLPGIVINLKGDTIKGFIDYKNWGMNPSKIKFKEKLDSTSFLFKPTDIIEFKVHDEIYVSGIIESEISTLNIENLQENPEINIKIDTTFLQTIIRGKKSLFYYKNSEGKENFYIKRDTIFELLIYKKYIQVMRKKGERLIIENKKYIGQLTVYLMDCSSIQSKLKTISYNLTSLEKLFQFYYQCTQYDITFQKKTEKIDVPFGILAGVTLSSLSFKSHTIPYQPDPYDYLVNADYQQSKNFSTGMTVDLLLPRNQKKWSLNNEIIFTSYKFTDEYSKFENNNNYSITTTEINLSYLKINNMVRFKYPLGKIYLYINGGISNGRAILGKNCKNEESYFYGQKRIEVGAAVPHARWYEQGYLIGTGVNYYKFSFEIRYEKGNGMSGSPALNSITKKYYFLCGYKF